MSQKAIAAARRAEPRSPGAGVGPAGSGGIAEVVRVAAALDEPFSVRDLALVLGRPEAEVALAATDAIAAGWLVDTGSGLEFASPDRRSAMAERVGPSILRSLRRAAGRALAESGAGAYRVARLFELGGEAGDREAIDWLVRGARERIAASPDDAVRLLRRALELSDRDHDRARVANVLARALTLAGRASEAADVAIAALWRPHDQAVEVGLVTALARALRAGGRPADAARLLGALLERIDGSTLPPQTHARLRAARGDALLLAGRPAAGDSEAATGLRLALKVDDGAAAGEARAALARGRLWRGDVEGALELSGAAARAALLGDDEEARADAIYLLAMHLMHADRFDESAALFTRELSAVDGPQDRRALIANRGLGFIAYHRGRWQEARSRLEAGWSDGLGRAAAMDLIASLAILAVIDVGQGRTSAALGWVDLAFEELGRTGTAFSIEWPLWARALIREGEGDVRQAREDVREAIAAMDESGTTYRLRFIGTDAARIAAAAEDPALARDVADRVSALAAVNARSFEAAARLCEGLATGRAEPFLAAAEQFRGTERVGELAAALEGAGVALARREWRGRDELVEALTIFEAMGAARHAARVRATLRQHGWRLGARRPHRRALVGWDSLTEAERAVARLVAEGLTNPQIAGRLFISPRTAESHVSRIRSKLGATSRVAIALAIPRSADEER